LGKVPKFSPRQLNSFFKPSARETILIGTDSLSKIAQRSSHFKKYRTAAAPAKDIAIPKHSEIARPTGSPLKLLNQIKMVAHVNPIIAALSRHSAGENHAATAPAKKKRTNKKQKEKQSADDFVSFTTLVN
jgi:hypothetical protein